MRITAEARRSNRETILENARRLFVANGYHDTTTREIASAAGLATGTLFNYFANKELLGLTIIGEALAEAENEVGARASGDESLEEHLFAHVAAGLRRLRPYRTFLDEVFEGAMSPFAQSSLGDADSDVRSSQLRILCDALRAHGHGPGTPLSLHLYWTLYLGVLAFWANDESPTQQDTLALLDQALTLFSRTLSEPNRSNVGADTDSAEE